MQITRFNPRKCNSALGHKAPSPSIAMHHDRVRRPLLLLASALLTLWALTFQAGLAQAATGKISLDLTYVAVGIGYQSGTATVTLNGQTAEYSVKGTQFLGGGASNFHAEGTVQGAHTLADIEGKYSVTRGSLHAIVGGTSLNLHNNKGVQISLQGTGTGIDASIGPGTLTFSRIGGSSGYEASPGHAKAEASSGARIATKAGKLPHVGLFAYTQAHAKNPNPPDRWGGTVTIAAKQKKGATQWVLPGPREMDPVVFGSPDHPIGWEQAPFPLIGIPPAMRQSMGGKYTIVDHATPFSNWRVIGLGDLAMKISDHTAIDGAKTKDKVHFVAEFDSPDKMHHYKVVVDKPMAHGFGYPTFGGVVTDHLLHGGTGIGTRLMPTEYVYASFWGIGDVYVDGRLTNPGQIVHMMVTEGVRGKGWQLGFDGDARGEGTVLHLMVPPYKASPKGPVAAPLRSGYIPFPEIKKRMMQAKEMVMQLPPEKRKAAMAKMEATKALMMRTKQHVQQAMAEGKMFGQPFFHVMFGNVKYTITHR